MSQAGDIIKDALIEITRLGAEAPVEQVDAQAAIRYLNRMMAGLDAKGLDLGYTVVSDFADTITIPAGAEEGVVFLLATRLWNQFSSDKPLPGALVTAAISGLQAIRDIAVTVGATEFPSTLPIGSGNEGDTTFLASHFYEDLQDTILAETTGPVGLEALTP